MLDTGKDSQKVPLHDVVSCRDNVDRIHTHNTKRSPTTERMTRRDGLPNVSKVGCLKCLNLATGYGAYASVGTRIVV